MIPALEVTMLSAALTLLLGLAPHESLVPEQYVRWAGCNAAVVTSEYHSVYASEYDPDGNVLYFGTRPDPEIGEEARLAVLLHETGHCLQFRRDGYRVEDYYLYPLTFELGADRYSSEMLCQLGRNAKDIYHDLFMRLYFDYGFTGDSTHGSIQERVAQADNFVCNASRQVA